MASVLIPTVKDPLSKLRHSAFAPRWPHRRAIGLSHLLGGLATTDELLDGAWKSGAFHADQSADDVGCHSLSFCLVSGSRRDVSIHPEVWPSSFKPMDGAAPGQISCPSSTFCPGTTNSKVIEVSDSPLPATGGRKRHSSSRASSLVPATASVSSRMAVPGPQWAQS